MTDEHHSVVALAQQMAVELDVDVLSSIAGGRAAQATAVTRVGLSTQGGDPGDVDISFD